MPQHVCTHTHTSMHMHITLFPSGWKPGNGAVNYIVSQQEDEVICVSVSKQIIQKWQEQLLEAKSREKSIDVQGDGHKG